MHLPPEVELLVPELVSRIAPPGTTDPEAERERIETLLLAGDPVRWLGYLRERGGLVEAAAHGGDADADADVAELATILRDQLALIQVALDLDPEDLALLGRLEQLEAPRRG